MGNLKERTKRMIVNVSYLVLGLAIAYGFSMAIVSCLGCSFHVMEKHYHYKGERPAVEVTNDEGITMEIDE